ncbi:hypothetical protein [Clostridium butyricum]|uniref:hypothetical protein n=1 Tax=Clostridium butyricum TaxID=1492 RepID=UPI0022E51F33|nr:hypothetical protein [Clostridium butyricum]
MNILNRYRTQNLYFMKIASFISSMFPFSVFIVLKYQHNYNVVLKYIHINILVNSIFLITILSSLYVIYFLKMKIFSRNFNRKQCHLKNINQEKTNTSSYLLSNVLPVVTLEMDSMNNVIFVSILILLLAFMYIKNNLYYINPIYDLINIKVYKADVFENQRNNCKNLFIISCVTLYEFNNNHYEGIRFGEILFITKNLD